jgi:hypothetical protein
MASSVQVTFGANITQLVSGINSATNELRRFAEGVAAMFTANQAAAFIAQFAEMGEQIERSAAMLGVSTKEVQELGLISKMTGGDQQALAMAVERLQVNLQHALIPTSQQALALRALGLSAQQMLAVPVTGQLNLMADAFKRLHDQGINPTSLGMMLMGRGAAGMTPILEQGSGALDQLRQHLEQTGAVMTDEAVTALADMNRGIVEAKASVTAMFGELAAHNQYLRDFAQNVATSAGNMSALIASGNLGAYVMEYLERMVAGAAAQLGKLATAFADVFTGNWGATFTQDMAAADAVIAATMRDTTDDLDSMLAKAKAAYKALLDEAQNTNANLKPPPAFGGNQDALNAELAATNAQVAALNAYYASQVEHINSLAKTFQITEQEKTRELIAAVNERQAAEEFWLQSELKRNDLTKTQAEKLQDELTKIQEKGAADRQKITDQAAQQEEKTWKAAADQISSALDSQLKGLLSGATSWSQAMKNITGDLIIKMIEDVAKWGLEWLASQARVLAGHLASETAMTSATAAGSAARTAAEQTSAASGMLANVAAAVQAIMRDAAQAFAGVFAFLAQPLALARARGCRPELERALRRQNRGLPRPAPWLEL